MDCEVYMDSSSTSRPDIARECRRVVIQTARGRFWFNEVDGGLLRIETDSGRLAVLPQTGNCALLRED